MQDILDVQQQEQQAVTKESLMHGDQKKVRALISFLTSVYRTVV